MRYYQIKIQGRTPMFRGFRLEKRWLDRTQPENTGVLRLMGVGSAEVTPDLVDRAGIPIPCTVEPAIPIAEDGPLMKQPEDRRQLIQISFTFPDAQPLTVIDTRDGSALVAVEPYIDHPDFLFALMNEAREAGFAPDGFINFVETGTLFGHTILHASYWVENAFTIELSKDLHAQAQHNLAHRSNVTCIQGNSGVQLPHVIAGLAGPTLFFLDAHWSGDSSVDWENSKFGGYPVATARIDDASLSEGERQVPLLQELEHIAENHAAAAMIVIDDWQTPGLKGANFVGEDWSHINPGKLIDWMDRHPRTFNHFQPSWNRYVWMLKSA